MPAFSVEKSIQINAPTEKVFARVRAFKGWADWSPWIIAEPSCPLEYAEDGKGYSWDGRIIGSGEMAIIKEAPSNSIDYRLTFLKPWKSECTTHFKFAEKDGGTEVIWSMNGSLPWFMFWMKGMMTTFVGMDYERGLAMLKDDIEIGSVPSKLEFADGQSFPGCNYIGIRRQSGIPDMGTNMEKDLAKLHEWLTESGSQPAGNPLSIYHKWKPTKGWADYTIAIPLASPPATLPEGFVTDELPAMATYTAKHTGPYRHLGNAWAGIMMHARGKAFAHKKSVPPFEIYANNPADTPENDLVTVVHLATK